MSKIKGLFESYCKEREQEIMEFHSGGEDMQDLLDYLKKKLNADEYFEAEELLNRILTKTEEKGFAAGCKYISELNQELLSK